MAAERLPHCSKCALSVDQFPSIKLVPCKHLYCPKCLSALTQCPIDNTPWDRSTLQESFTLLPAISNFLNSQDPAAEDLLYEDINVNSVKCRLIAKPGHDRSKCRYNHPSQLVETKSEWTCPKCQIQITDEKDFCPMCLAGRPPSTGDGEQTISGRTGNYRQGGGGGGEKPWKDTINWGWVTIGLAVVGLAIYLSTRS